MDILNQMLPTHVVDANQKIHLSVEGSNDHDSLTWTLTPSGNFSTKSVYKQYMKRRVSSSSKIEFIPRKVFKAIWNLKYIPHRIIIFIWICLHTAIAVKGNLSKLINNIEPLCPFCDKEVETIDHLLFNCEFSQLL